MIEHIRRFVKVRSGGCWEWQGAKAGSLGYGVFRKGRQTVYAHREAWIAENGPIKQGYCVLHKCDNPLCVNPRHLWVGTQRDNIRDMDRKNRRGDTSTSGYDRPVKLDHDKAADLLDRYDKLPRHENGRVMHGCVAVLAEHYGVSKATVWRIARGESWR